MVSRAWIRILLTASLVALGGPLLGQVSYELDLALDPVRHTLTVSAVVTLPEGDGEDSRRFAEFLLLRRFEIQSSSAALEELDGSAGSGGDVARYRVEGLGPGSTLSLRYEGVVDFGLLAAEEEYARGFRETVGFVGEEGVYLAGSTFWYPTFEGELVRFELEASGPEGWHLISQGRGTSRDSQGRARWSSGTVMEEIFVVGGPLEVTRDTGLDGVEAAVYLHERDDALAGKYLKVTFQYIDMYRRLIGPYPYSKFALVENFWETGYGMPSFTLLGPTVLRLPFILHSSYPHEILHNWWGNSVFVDLSQGNWCEGLTAYLADHLIQEQRGTAWEYRRSTLQKYRSYVQEGEDFPLVEFRSRHNAASAAVGYGKALMGFHALRLRLGDSAFRRFLAQLYARYRGQRAGLRDLRQVAESVSGEDLETFFRQWTTRVGAPSLSVTEPRVKPIPGGYRIEAWLDQSQDGEPYSLRVPVVVETEGEPVRTVLSVDGARTSFAVTTEDRPLRLRVDPEFDLFRRLDPREIPPSVGQLMGEPEILALLPSRAPAEEVSRYRRLLDAWRSPSQRIEVALDSERDELPADRSVWVLGRDNRWARELASSLSPAELALVERGLRVAGQEFSTAGHTAVVVGHHPHNLEKALGWIAVHPPQAFSGLARKLPHYGKYSYLVFQGEEPENVAKGQWTPTASPLQVDLRPLIPEAGRAEEGDRPGATAELPRRRPLAELPPAFSERALLEHVTYLTQPSLQGRGLGTSGLHQAATYIARQLEGYGLRPGAPEGSYLQDVPASGPEGEVVSANVIAYVPGTDSALGSQSVVLVAHYDHLGLGWPDALQANRGRVHPGADDNASGVAVLLELARSFASTPGRRNLVFLVSTGEEAGRVGSRYFAAHPTPFPWREVQGAINLDTVGRLFDGELQVLGTGSAREWPHIFRGSSYVTGVASRMVADSVDGSDHTTFLEGGVPAVQVFSGAHGDYHRPSDTVERLDIPGLVRVASFVQEALGYLVEADRPLTPTLGSQPDPTPSPPPSGGRRVSFGSLPDFAFSGPGVRFEDVLEGSPAHRAGLKPGDVLSHIDGTRVRDLAHFSSLLRTLTPGQEIRVRVSRGDSVIEVDVEVAAR